MADLLCKNRTSPLLIGTVKSNMGHSEPASGLCSIAKVLIAMETGTIPPNLHFTQPNPNIPALADGRLQVIVFFFSSVSSRCYQTFLKSLTVSTVLM